MNPASATESPQQTLDSLTIKRIIELSSSSEDTPGAKAQLMIARSDEGPLSHRQRSKLCRHLLDQLISLTSPGHGMNRVLHLSASGAPFLEDDGKRSHLNISLAHSGQWLAAGVALGAKIGVDIEPFRTRQNYQKMAHYLGWQTPVVDARDFYCKWTLWEASVKCVEGGLMMSENPGFEALQSFDLRDRVQSTQGWSGINGSVDNDLAYAVVLHTVNNCELIHRELQPGVVDAW